MDWSLRERMGYVGVGVGGASQEKGARRGLGELGEKWGKMLRLPPPQKVGRGWVRKRRGMPAVSHRFLGAAAAAAMAATAGSATISTAGGLRPGPWGARGGSGPGRGPVGHTACADRLGGRAGARGAPAPGRLLLSCFSGTDLRGSALPAPCPRPLSSFRPFRLVTSHGPPLP